MTPRKAIICFIDLRSLPICISASPTRPITDEIVARGAVNDDITQERRRRL